MPAPAASVSIRLPDGSERSYDAPVTPRQVAESISDGLARNALAAKVDGRLVDLNAPIDGDAAVEILTSRSPESLEVLRHSCTHLMAQAIKRLRPDAMLEDGPPTDEGFWYDIKTDPPITPEDFPAIEAEMQKIVKEALPIERRELSREEALELFRERGEKYKVDLIERIPDSDTISTYRQGEFIDLCRGPHVPHTGVFQAFQLMSVAGAYWKGDARNDQLTRVKGTAFHTRKELKAYLDMLEEAKKRDHRKLGRELELLMTHEWAPGVVFWLPRGLALYRTLARMMSDLCREEGYVEVFTPMLFKKDLFETSGHWNHYRDDMFIVPGQEAMTLDEAGVAEWAHRLEDEAPDILTANEYKRLLEELAPLATPADRLAHLLAQKGIGGRHWRLFRRSTGEFVLLEDSGETTAIKPMNCPSHMLIFRERKRSYKELPLRIHDQGVLHRNETSGTLSGTTRTRQFCQDDAHIFLSQEQIEDEITSLIALVKRVYTAFGMEFARVYLSTRPDEYLGEKETWDTAEAALEAAIRSNHLDYRVNEGDGAFYGPKIDFIVRDCLGRDWQTATIQLDYQLPARFGLRFVNRDNEEEMPIVVHRAIYGSFERFLAILIEHFGGNFPLWLAPEQVRVLTISEKFEDYARTVQKELAKAGFRAEIDLSAEKVGAKIREGRNMRIPYLAIVGEKEQETRTVSLRSQTEGELGSLPLEDFLARLRSESRDAY